MVRLACINYEEPDSKIIGQAIYMRNQIQSFLITNGPFLPVQPRKTPVATQDNRISVEEQQEAIAQYFGTQLPAARRTWTTASVVHTNNLQQQTLVNTW